MNSLYLKRFFQGISSLEQIYNQNDTLRIQLERFGEALVALEEKAREEIDEKNKWRTKYEMEHSKVIDLEAQLKNLQMNSVQKNTKLLIDSPPPPSKQQTRKSPTTQTITKVSLVNDNELTFFSSAGNRVVFVMNLFPSKI